MSRITIILSPYNGCQRQTYKQPMNSPFSLRILLLLLILLAALAILLQIGILSFAFQKLGLSAGTALGILLAAMVAEVPKEMLSIGRPAIISILILLWMLMFWYAGHYQPQGASDTLGNILKEAPAAGQPAEGPSGEEGEE